jgi:hypothetical protein
VSGSELAGAGCGGDRQDHLLRDVLNDPGDGIGQRPRELPDSGQTAIERREPPSVFVAVPVIGTVRFALVVGGAADAGAASVTAVAARASTSAETSATRFI